MSYKGILFDLDGVILPSSKLHYLAWKKVCFYENIPFSNHIYQDTLGISKKEALEVILKKANLTFDEEKKRLLIEEKNHYYEKYLTSINEDFVSSSVKQVLNVFKENNIKMAIASSSTHAWKLLEQTKLLPYFNVVVSGNDVKNPKPSPDSLLKYMQDTGAKPQEILFIGDTKTDCECADQAGVDFALALWGYTQREHLNCAYYFASPWSILSAAVDGDCAKLMWFKWAREIQAIGQIGLAYSKDRFDIERFTRLREIALEIMHTYTEAPLEKIKEAFCFDKGYITVKSTDYSVMLSSHISDEKISRQLRIYEGRRIELPHNQDRWPEKEFLEYHNDVIFKH